MQAVGHKDNLEMWLAWACEQPYWGKRNLITGSQFFLDDLTQKKVFQIYEELKDQLWKYNLNVPKISAAAIMYYAINTYSVDNNSVTMGTLCNQFDCSLPSIRRYVKQITEILKN